jgi:hypothetical protein
MKRFVFVAAMCVVPSFASAQDEPGGWVDVNVGVASSGQDPFTAAFAGLLYGEPAALAAAYPQPSRGADFDLGGGLMFTPLWGVGVSFTGTAHEDQAGLALTVPHPFFVNASATAADITADRLQRAETALHLKLAAAPLRSSHFTLRLFGGPSYFRVEQDSVEDISFSQTAFPFSRINIVTITGFQGTQLEGSGWGYHAGADLGVFFSRVVGVGGMFRFSRASVEVFDPLASANHDLDAGGVQFGGGLRLRF